MESHGLMFELSHPERINILNLLKEKPRRLSQLSKELDVNTAEVSRHLDRLGKAGLIDRDSSNNYNLTTFANIILSEVSKFDFLTNNIEYFLKHDVSCIPEHLHWFNAMAKGSLSKGTLETTSLIKETSENAKKFVYVISNEVMRGMVDIDCKKMDSGVVFKKIYPRDAQLPTEYESRMGKSLEIKILEEVPVGLKMNEKFAGVGLMDTNGKVDLSVVMIGRDESFRSWVEAIFNYYWKKAKPIL
jgi:predicted transcriptional regulator